MDVEQIMHEIRSRIAERHGVELTDQQIQDLAARRLESILDPRTIKPSLLDQLRRSAGARPDTVAAADRAAVPYEFEDTTLYDSPSGFTRAVRGLLNPILKLFFNPNPLVRALHIQARLNVEAARREAERDERQAEWNALHYEILQRVVTETARLTLELQSLALQVESLSAKVDFNERRVRGIEGAVHQPRPTRDREPREREPREREPREREPREREPRPAAAVPGAEGMAPASESPSPESPGGEAPRRRRRRRRGRRSGGPAEQGAPVGDAAVAGTDTIDSGDAVDVLEADEEDAEPEALETTGPAATEAEPEAAPVESAIHAAPAADAALPEQVTPQLESPDPDERQDAAPALPAAPPPADEDPREPR